jgi:RNA polymerase sigma-70 factor (ECF subfamily)
LAKTANEDTRAAELAEVRAIAGGDQSAFVRLIDRESPRLLRFAQGVLGSLEEAEDVVQESLISLWENAGTWRPEARIGTWLHRVCYNRAIDRLRRRQPLAELGDADEFADASPLAETMLVRDETIRSVRDAVERLPLRQRSAVLLFHFQDLTQSQAAEILDVSESAFESLLARARRQLRAWLTAPGGDHE